MIAATEVATAVKGIVQLTTAHNEFSPKSPKCKAEGCVRTYIANLKGSHS